MEIGLSVLRSIPLFLQATQRRILTEPNLKEVLWKFAVEMKQVDDLSSYAQQMKSNNFDSCCLSFEIVLSVTN